MTGQPSDGSIFSEVERDCAPKTSLLGKRKHFSSLLVWLSGLKLLVAAKPRAAAMQMMPSADASVSTNANVMGIFAQPRTKELSLTGVKAAGTKAAEDS